MVWTKHIDIVYSNMLAYFFYQNRKVFTDFVREVLKVKVFSQKYIIKREYHKVDLLVVSYGGSTNEAFKR